MLIDLGDKAYGAKLWSADDYGRDEILCLDFANLVSWRGKPDPTDSLPEPSAWLKWIRDRKLVSESALAELDRRAGLWPGEVQGAHKRAIEFREALYNLLSDFCRDKAPQGQDEAAVQEVLESALEELRLDTSSKPWQWQLEATGVDWDAALQPIALSAAQLLTSAWADRLHVCERDECQWLFLDLTKNHSRKWCSMDTCGNVIKARRNYAKRKAGR